MKFQLAILLIALNIIIQSNSQQIMVLQAVFSQACVSEKAAEGYQSTIVLFIHTGLPTGVSQIEFSAKLLSVSDDSFVADSILCQALSDYSSYGNFLYCYFMAFPKTQGKYYVKSDGATTSEYILLPFSLKDNVFEVTSTDYNIFSNYDIHPYISYHGQSSEKDSYIYLPFTSEFEEDTPIYDIYITVNDTSAIPLDCSVYSFDASYLSCLVPGNSMPVGEALFGKIETPCTGLTDTFVAMYIEVPNIMSITGYSIDEKCKADGENIGNISLSYEVKEGSFPEGYVISGCMKLKSGTSETDVDCQVTSSDALTCQVSSSASYLTAGTYDLIVFETCSLDNNTYAVRPFKFEKVMGVNLDYVKPVSDDLEFFYDYADGDDYEFDIEFDSSISSSAIPEVYIDEKLVSCTKNKKILTCTVNIDDYPPPIEDLKSYSGYIVNVCGFKEKKTILLNVTDSNEKPAMTLYDLSVDKTCGIFSEEITKLYVRYVFEDANYTGTIKDFNIYLENEKDESVKITYLCSNLNSSDNLFTCESSEPKTTQITTGKYIPKLREGAYLKDYIIKEFISDIQISISGSKLANPVDPIVDDKIEVYVPFGSDESAVFEITFDTLLDNDNIPTIIIDSKELLCEINEDDKLILQCTVNKTDFPTGDESTVYNGTLKNYCDKDYYEIILVSQNQIKITVSNPTLSANEKLTCTRLDYGISISFDTTNKDKFTGAYTIENKIQLQGVEKAGIISTTCTISNQGLECAPVNSENAENDKYKVVLNEQLIFENILALDPFELSEDSQLIHIHKDYLSISIVEDVGLQGDVLDFKDIYQESLIISFESNYKSKPKFFGKLLDDSQTDYFKTEDTSAANRLNVTLSVNELNVEEDTTQIVSIYMKTVCDTDEFVKKITVKNTGLPIVTFSSASFLFTDGDSNKCSAQKVGSYFGLFANKNTKYIESIAVYSNVLLCPEEFTSSENCATTKCQGMTQGILIALVCQIDSSPKVDGIYNIRILKSETVTENFRIKDYTSSETVNVNRNFVGLKNTDPLDIVHDYKEYLRGQFSFEFKSTPDDKSYKVMINNRQFDCVDGDGTSVICYFFEKDLPLETDEVRTYTGEVLDACGNNALSINITVTKDTSPSETQITLKKFDYTFKKCISYTKSYPFEITYDIYEPSLSLGKDYKLSEDTYLYNNKYSKKKIEVSCQSSTENNKFTCTTLDESSSILPETISTYYFKTTDNIQTEDSYIVYSYKSSEEITFTQLNYAEPKTNNVEVYANYKDNANPTFSIEFNSNLVDLPSVIFEDHILVCEGNENILTCEFNDTILPAITGNKNENKTYTGYLINVCREKEVIIDINVCNYKKSDSATAIAFICCIAGIIIIIVIILIIIKCKKKKDTALSEEIMHISTINNSTEMANTNS